MRINEITQLDELIGVKHLGQTPLDKILNQLSKTDWKHLGSGGRAFVVNRSNDKVIKFWFQDQGYEKFLQYVDSHPSEHFPRFFSRVKQLKNFSDSQHKYPTLNYIVLEKLQTLDTRHAYDVESLRNLMDVVRSQRISSQAADFNQQLAQAMHSHGEWWEENAEAVVARCSSILHVLLKLDEDTPIGIRLDLHHSNFMLRGETMVLTDPFVDGDRSNNEFEQEIKNNLDF